MKKFTGHREPWGTFVDVKVNAAELLAAEIRKKKKGNVWISGVCDAYQQAEQKYMLTRRCLEILVENGWPVTIQTKSPLVLRDIEILRRSPDIEIGFTITTADEKVRRIFEPGAPPIEQRIKALEILHAARIKTYAMIAPMLPGAEGLADMLKGKINHVMIDRYNYNYADRLFKKFGMDWALAENYFQEKGRYLKTAFEKTGIFCRILY